MKRLNLTGAALFTLLFAATGTSTIAEEGPELHVPAETDVSPELSVAVEEDHGDGLGPLGRDLHNHHTALQAGEDDAELFLQSLEESPQPIVNIDTGVPSEPAAGMASGE